MDEEGHMVECLGDELLGDSPKGTHIVPVSNEKKWPYGESYMTPMNLYMWHTVDGRDPANQLRLVVYPILYDGFFTF